MIYSVRPLFGFPVHEADGEIGKIFDLYFDDKSWDIKYFVVEVEGQLFDKRVLIEPKMFSIGKEGYIRTPLIISELRHCHDYDTQKPVCRLKKEKGQYRGSTDDIDEDNDVHLRSVTEVMKYRIITKNGKIGLIKDLYFNEQTWKIDQLIMTIENSLFAETVQIPVSHVESIIYEDSKVFVS